MKQLVCSGCGSSSLKKQIDNTFICEFCGSVFVPDSNDNVKSVELIDAEILALFVKADDFRGQDKYSSEIDVLTKALALNEQNVVTWVRLGRAYRNYGNINKALECYKKAIDINPRYAQIYTNIGVIHILNKQYIEAISYLEKSIELYDKNDTDYPTAVANYGIAKALSGDKILGAKLINKAEKEGYFFANNARKTANLSVLTKLLGT